MCVKPGVIVVESTSDPLSLWYPAAFRVMRRQFLSAWHYLLYMKAMHLKFYGTADRMLTVKNLDELEVMAAPLEQVSQDRWLQGIRFDLIVANSNKFQAHPDMLEVLLGTDTQLIVSTTHPGTFWSAPAPARHAHLGDKASWVGCNMEGIALMRARELLTPTRDPAGADDRDTAPLSLATKISKCWTWDPDRSDFSEATHAAWLAEIRVAPAPEVIYELHALMRRRYWDVDIDDPYRADFVEWARSKLGIGLPPNPLLAGARAGS
jgi:ribA/ribD-fused uncharacterized protein